MPAIWLPNGNLLIPDDSDDRFGLLEIGPDDPEYGPWLATSVPGEDPRPKKNRERHEEERNSK
jgi:hypothetical protein